MSFVNYWVAQNIRNLCIVSPGPLCKNSDFIMQETVLAMWHSLAFPFGHGMSLVNCWVFQCIRNLCIVEQDALCQNSDAIIQKTKPEYHDRQPSRRR
jgi:hypothetical protein